MSLAHPSRRWNDCDLFQLMSAVGFPQRLTSNRIMELGPQSPTFSLPAFGHNPRILSALRWRKGTCVRSMSCRVQRKNLEHL